MKIQSKVLAGMANESQMANRQTLVKRLFQKISMPQKNTLRRITTGPHRIHPNTCNTIITLLKNLWKSLILLINTFTMLLHLKIY